MKNVLICYSSHAGHTARIARVMSETIREAGASCDMMDVTEAVREGVQWKNYDLVIVGAAVIYGVYNKHLWEFVERFHDILDKKKNAFFNVTVVARTPFKATVAGNRYMQRFLQKSPWRPMDLKCIAGKVDYPHWNWYQKLAIMMIMKMTKGPTDPTTIIDYTDWNDVREYALKCLSMLDEPAPAAEPVAKPAPEPVAETVAQEAISEPATQPASEVVPEIVEATPAEKPAEAPVADVIDVTPVVVDEKPAKPKRTRKTAAKKASEASSATEEKTTKSAAKKSTAKKTSTKKAPAKKVKGE